MKYRNPIRSKDIRLEMPKTRLTGTSFSVTAVDEYRLTSLGVVNPTYGEITIEGVATAFATELNVGDVIQFCSDAQLYDAYTSTDSSLGLKYKYASQFESILDEYEVTAINSQTELIAVPYTNFDEEFHIIVERTNQYYLHAVDKGGGLFDPIFFTTVYKKDLTASGYTTDMIVNSESISIIVIDAATPQNMIIHLLDTGAPATRTLTVHNCFDYLLSVLEPFTQLETSRVLFQYSNTHLTTGEAETYSNFKFVDRPKEQAKAKIKEEKAKANMNSESSIRNHKEHR
jgi:hypothetical protein